MINFLKDLWEEAFPKPLPSYTLFIPVDREALVEEFHRAFDHPVEGEWTPELLSLRSALIGEESLELLEEFKWLAETPPEEWETADKERLLKEMADLQYVLSGAAVALGLNLEGAYIRVHKSNMSKLGEDGKPVRREDGKVLKGPNYQPPILEDLL